MNDYAYKNFDNIINCIIICKGFDWKEIIK